MKKLLIFTAAASAALVLASAAANAQTIGVQFSAYYASSYSNLNGSHYAAANYSAGVVPQINWNVANGGTGTGDGMVLGPITNANLISNYPTQDTPTGNPLLETSTDATPNAAITFTYSGANVERGSQGSGFANNTGNNLLYGGDAFNTGGAVTLTLGGLTATDNYTFIAYLQGDYYYYSGQTVGVSLGNLTPVYVTLDKTLGTFAQGTSTNVSAPSDANYVEFTLTGAQLDADTLTINPMNANGATVGGAGLAGFQLIDDGSSAIPEPSSIGLFTLGLLGVGIFVRRNRAVREI
jgi:hypothetical protein